jgi:hypothetical protein
MLNPYSEKRKPFFSVVVVVVVVVVTEKPFLQIHHPIPL